MDVTPQDVIIVGGTTALVVLMGVALHYEGLSALRRLPHAGFQGRYRISLLILGILALHSMEIWLFGLSYMLLLNVADVGSLTGSTGETVFDYVYFSATVFTTLGFGDIVPAGPIRLMVGTEAVTGLTFITWSASFTYIELTEEHSHRK